MGSQISTNLRHRNPYHTALNLSGAINKVEEETQENKGALFRPKKTEKREKKK